jgi:hypothetical protein
MEISFYFTGVIASNVSNSIFHILVDRSFEIICCLACALPGVPDTRGINNGRSKLSRNSLELSDTVEKH